MRFAWIFVALAVIFYAFRSFAYVRPLDSDFQIELILKDGPNLSKFNKTKVHAIAAYLNKHPEFTSLFIRTYSDDFSGRDVSLTITVLLVLDDLDKNKIKFEGAQRASGRFDNYTIINIYGLSNPQELYKIINQIKEEPVVTPPEESKKPIIKKRIKKVNK